MHWRCHCFNTLCQNIYFYPELQYLAKILCWWRDSWTALLNLLKHNPKVLSGVKVRTLWGPIHVWKWFHMFLSKLRVFFSSKHIFFPGRGWFATIPPDFSNLWVQGSVLNLVLVVSAIFFDALFTWSRPIIWPFWNIVFTTTRYVLQHGCWRTEKLLTSSDRVKELIHIIYCGTFTMWDS